MAQRALVIPTYEINLKFGIIMNIIGARMIWGGGGYFIIDYRIYKYIIRIVLY